MKAFVNTGLLSLFVTNSWRRSAFQHQEAALGSEGLGVYCICNEETFIAAVYVPVTANGELKVTVWSWHHEGWIKTLWLKSFRECINQRSPAESPPLKHTGSKTSIYCEWENRSIVMGIIFILILKKSWKQYRIVWKKLKNTFKSLKIYIC